MRKLLALSLLLLASPLYAGQDWQPLVIGPFGGLNARDTSFAMPANASQVFTNMDVTPGGRSIKTRSGYASYATISGASGAIHNIYAFFDQSGNDYVLAFNAAKILYSKNGAAFATAYSTATSGAVYDCADYLGYAYCVNSARDGIYKTPGNTAAFLTGNVSSGTIVEACPTRLAMAGFSGSSSSQIHFSGEGDFNSWGTGALGSSPVQLTVNAPGSKITHLVYAFGRLMWFKESSFGYVIIGNQPAQTDWIIKTVSKTIGTLDNTSSQDPDGNLYFRGQDKRIYKYDGSTAMDFSQEISGYVALSTASSSEQAYSTFFDNKLWFSIPWGNGATSNGAAFVYDFQSSAWSFYFPIGINGFAVRNNQLLFGDSSNASVYVYGSTNTDNGTAIGWEWASKDFFFDNPFNAFDVTNLSIAFNTIYNPPPLSAFIPGTTMNALVYVDQHSGSPKSISTYILDYPGNTGTGGKAYTTKNMQISPAVGANAHTVECLLYGSYPIEIFGVQFGVRPRPWKPEP